MVAIVAAGRMTCVAGVAAVAVAVHVAAAGALQVIRLHEELHQIESTTFR